jgi:hypothetical protein
MDDMDLNSSNCTEMIRNTSKLTIIYPNTRTKSADIKNRKLVELLKNKAFKGFEKTKLKDKEQFIEIPEYGEIFANNEKFIVRFKNRGKLAKTAKYREKSPLEIMHLKPSTARPLTTQTLFITEKNNEINSARFTRNYSKENLNIKIFSNQEEEKLFSYLTIQPFNIKKPDWRIHYNNLNKTKFMNDLQEVGKEEEMRRMLKNEFLYKISRPVKEEVKQKKINFNTNRGLFKIRAQGAQTTFADIVDPSTDRSRSNVETHNALLKRKAAESCARNKAKSRMFDSDVRSYNSFFKTNKVDLMQNNFINEQFKSSAEKKKRFKMFKDIMMRDKGNDDNMFNYLKKVKL